MLNSPSLKVGQLFFGSFRDFLKLLTTFLLMGFSLDDDTSPMRLNNMFV